MGPVHFLRRTKEGPYTAPSLPDGCPPFPPTLSLLLPKEGEMSRISITPPFEIAEFNNRQRRSADQRGGGSANLTPGHQDSWRAKGSLTVAFLVLGPYRVKNAPQSCLPRSARHCLPSIWRRKRMEGEEKRIKHPQGEMGKTEGETMRYARKTSNLAQKGGRAGRR